MKNNTIENPKSPLRYPGGKTRAASKIVDKFPTNIKIIYSPFAGGMSIELEAASRGYNVITGDIFAPVCCFWNELLKDPRYLIKESLKYLSLTREEFYSLQNELRSYLKDSGFTIKNKKDTKRVALLFFILNRSSFSGTTLSGGMSPGHPRFTVSCIDRLNNFANFKLKLTVRHSDFRDLLSNANSGDFVYADPPYLIESNLYGDKGSTHSSFNHEDFVATMKDLDKKDVRWLVSYNDCPQVRDWFENYKIKSLEWKYGMGANKKSKEIIIMNY
jgi:DNA adenine methylase